MNQTHTVGVSMGEAARLTVLPVETLRYYDRAGLLGDLPDLGVIDWKIAAYTAAEAGRESPPPPPGWPAAPPDLTARESTPGDPS